MSVAVAVKTEERELTMHKKLLMDTINRQAGTLQKAVLEGIMNAIEALSPVVEVDFKVDDVGNATISIRDAGIGIETKQDLLEHFEKFGTPHEASENTYWKQFRMGRGQMFSFGRNVWRTSTFQMEVDIDNKGLSYELQEGLPYVDGCHIEISLYKNPIGYSYSSIDEFKETIQNQVRFMNGRILFNGEQINTPASECNWSFEDDDAYYLFNLGVELPVYNLGAFVMNAPVYEMGMMGVVVSKQQLKVNFARNDIQHDCDIYNRIKAVIKQNRIKQTRKARRTLDSWERMATLKDLRNGTQNYEDVQNLALIPTAQGKHISLESIRKIKQGWCFAPVGDSYADRIMEREQAICLSNSILVDFGYNGEEKEFFIWLTENQPIWKYENSDWQHVATLHCNFSQLKSGISSDYCTIPDKRYTATERRIIKILQNMPCWNDRRILLGSSEIAIGWTDGYSYICIEREWLRTKSLTYGPSIAKVMLLLSHEMAHSEESKGSHIHGPEFYEKQVEYMEGVNSPMGYCSSFADSIRSSKIDERREKEKNKISKAKDKVQKTLGIAAKSK